MGAANLKVLGAGRRERFDAQRFPGAEATVCIYMRPIQTRLVVGRIFPRRQTLFFKIYGFNVLLRHG